MLPERAAPVLAAVRACPVCSGDLRTDSTSLTCMLCSAAFKLHGRIPVFLKEPVTIPPENHRSNPIGAEFETILREGKDFVLHIGAGVSAQRYPNCIELERRPFRHTDVVGDAHSLPFRAGSFDRVFAFNVFEHLAEPRKAAAESYACLSLADRSPFTAPFCRPYTKRRTTILTPPSSAFASGFPVSKLSAV